MLLSSRVMGHATLSKTCQRALAVRACTHGRFTEIWGREAYNPGVIGALSLFSNPHVMAEVAWYESKNCFGCIVYSEPKTTHTKKYHFPKIPEYSCIVFSKEEPFDFECMDPLVSVGGFDDITLAGEFIKERLAALE